MGFAKKLLAVVLALSFLLLVVPGPGSASYRISLTGAVDFQAEPWTPVNLSGYVVVGLGAESQSQLDVTLTVAGNVAGWLTWTDPSSFTLYPDQQVFVHYSIAFPSLPPDEYTGQISAVGVPTPGAQTGGAAVPGNVAVAIGVSIETQSRRYLRDLYADGIGAAATVANFVNEAFNGSVIFNRTQGTAWIETQTVNIANMSANSTLIASALWTVAPGLGITYTVTFRLYDVNASLIDEAALDFRLPTPADILNTWHEPSIVYEDYDARIFGTVFDSQSGVTGCMAHYIIDGGTEQTGPMLYEGAGDRYWLEVDNTSYSVGSIVEYWVTSVNNATGTPYTGASVHKVFRVYSSTAPDLAIDDTSINFRGINPLNATMYDVNSTNIEVWVRNLGRGGATDIRVQMVDEHNGSVAFTDVDIIASLSSLDIGVATFVWDSPAAGGHNLKFVVDPDDNITETNENNNYYAVDVTVTGTEVPPPEPAEDPWELVPFILIPLVVLLLLLVFLLIFRKNNIKVTVLEAKEFTRTKDKVTVWRYTCGYGEDRVLGITKSTDIKAKEGDTVLVQPKQLTAREDGGIVWAEARVVKVVDGPADTEEQILKRAGK